MAKATFTSEGTPIKIRYLDYTDRRRGIECGLPTRVCCEKDQCEDYWKYIDENDRYGGS